MKRWWNHPKYGPAIQIAGSLLAGLVVGIFLHYLLYRFSLPMKPFIYVTF